MKLDFSEKQYLELIYKGINCTDEIADVLNLQKDEVHSLNKQVVNKLPTNSKFNYLRKAFEYNLLNKDKYRDLSVEDEVNKASDAIKKIKAIDKNDNEVKLSIYYILLELYSKLEYDVLLKEF